MYKDKLIEAAALAKCEKDYQRFIKSVPKFDLENIAEKVITYLDKEYKFYKSDIYINYKLRRILNNPFEPFDLL